MLIEMKSGKTCRLGKLFIAYYHCSFPALHRGPILKMILKINSKIDLTKKNCNKLWEQVWKILNSSKYDEVLFKNLWQSIEKYTKFK